MTDRIEFARAIQAEPTVEKLVLAVHYPDPSPSRPTSTYYRRLATPDDLRAAGWVPAIELSKCGWDAALKAGRRIDELLGIRGVAGWEETVAAVEKLKAERDAALLRVQELETECAALRKANTEKFDDAVRLDAKRRTAISERDAHARLNTTLTAQRDNLDKSLAESLKANTQLVSERDAALRRVKELESVELVEGLRERFLETSAERDDLRVK